MDMALYVYEESRYIKRTQFYIYIESRKIVLMNLSQRRKKKIQRKDWWTQQGKKRVEKREQH